MGFSEFWIQGNNGRKEQLGDTKHGIRREQIDKKYQNLFDVYDTNQDGTLENEELNVLLKGLKTFAGKDKVLDTNENKMLSSIFAKEIQIENADFQGFVEAISDAAGAIVSTEETMGEDGGKVITTEYNNGLVETLYYYPDGEFKMKKVLHDSENTTYTLNGKSYSKKQLDAIIKNAYDKFCSAQTDSISFTTYEGFAHDFIEKYNVCPHTQKYHREDLEMSDRAKQDASVRDFILNHFIETHKLTRESLDTMGILDDIGAAINAGGGELWNAFKNIYNKHFGDGSESDYQNFYELVKKFEPEYNKALVAEGNLETMRNNPELYLEGFKQRTGMDFNSAQGIKFLKVTEQYQNAQILKERLSILNKALSEIRMYQSAQDAITYAPVQSEGLNPADHILKANELLLQYFGGDKEAAELVLSGTIGNPERTMETINGLIEDTEKLNSEVLNGKSFDEVKNDYINQYKEIYNTDFVPDELTEKVMDAKATGGMVKIAAITLISIIITRSPAMAGILRASAGTAVDGAAANVIRTLVSKYGQTTVQQGIKLAMSSGTVATDVGLTLLNQVTSERGINGEELWETTKNAAKYIYFGTYIGGPIAQAVSSRLGKIGLTGKLFAGGTKTTQGAITTTTVTGDKLVENFMKSSKSILAKGGAMASEIASFSLLDLATGADDVAMVIEEQGKMLPAIKIMHNLFEYMLGAKAHTAISKANFEAAIERSGIKDWTIKETKTPSGVTYSVDMKGIPLGTFKDVNTLATAMFERVAKAYSETGNGNIQAPNGALEAKSTNPADNITPRLKGEVYRKEFKEEGMRLNTPERIDAELREAEANPNAQKENLEALSIVASGKTSEILTQRYSEMAKVLDEIHVTYAKEIQQLETKFGNNPEQFAKHFMSFLADKMGVSGCEPEIVFTKTEGDGAYNWKTGQIYISDKLKNCKDIKIMIAHEFIHTLQFCNVLSTYGKDGVTELYMKHNNGKAIEDLTKNYVRNEFGVEIEELGLTKEETIALQENVAEAYADRCLASGANPRLLKYAQEHTVEQGSLNSYMGRLHLDNLIKPEEFDTEAYYRSTNESEAYYLGNGQITGRGASGESAQNIDAGTSQRASGITLPMGKLEAEHPSLAKKLKNAAAKFNYELSRNLNRVQRGVNYIKEKAAGMQRIGKALSWAYDYGTLNLKLKNAGVKDNYYRKGIIEEIQNSQFESKEIYNSVINSIKTLKEMNVAEHTISNVLISTTSAGENNVRVFNQNSVAIIEELVKLRELCGSEWKKDTASRLLNIAADNSTNLAKLKEYTATMQEGYSFEKTQHMISFFGIKGENGRKIFREILNSPAVQENTNNYTNPEFLAGSYYIACTNSKGEFIGKNWEYLQQLYSAGIKNPEKILNVIKNDNNEITQANINTLMEQLETNPAEVNYYDYSGRLKNCLNNDGLIDFSRMGDVNTLSGIASGLDITYFQNKDGSYNKEAIAQLQKLQDAGFRDKSSEINNILAAARSNAAAAKEEGVILSPETIDIAIELKNKGIEKTIIGNMLLEYSEKDGHINIEMLNTFEPVAKLLTRDDGYALTELFPILKSAGNPEIKENIIKNVQRLLEGGYNLFDICQSGIITNRGTVSDAVIDAAIKLKQENFTENLRENLEKVRMEDGSLNKESFNFLLKLKEEGFDAYRCADIIKLCTRDNGEFISENTQIVLNLVKEYNNSKYTGDSPYHLVKILVNASADKAGVIREDILKENQSKLDKLFNKLDSQERSFFSYYLELAVTKDGVFDDNVFKKINELKNIDDGVIDPNYHKSLFNFIDACRNEDGSFNLEAYNDGIKLVQKYGMDKWTASFAIPVYREFKHLENKNFVYDLSLQEKRSLQSKLLQYNQNLKQLKKLKGIIKSELLPTTDAEYSTLMKQLSQSLGETDLRLDMPALDRLSSDISSLYKSGVTKPAEEVSLKENYDVLLKRIQSKMSGLSESEKRKIYDYFGFTVKNGKISGFPSTFGKNIEYTDITNSFSRKVVDAVTRVIDEFNANNSINVKGNPELSSLLTSISKNVPEILNKFSNSQKAAETVNLLNSISNSSDFAKLGESDKTVLILAVLLKDSNAGNLQESAYTIFNITAKLNLSARDREKLYKLLIIPDLITNYENANPNKIIQRFSRMDNYKSNEKEEALDVLAFSIKEDNVDKLAYLLYSSGNNGIMSNNLKTTLQDRIFEITKDDFVLPQTSAETLSASKGSVMTIQGYNVEVIEASSIPGFYAYVHTPEAGACNHSSRVTKFSNFEEFKNVDNNSVICASFVSADKSATWRKHGFLFKIKSGHEYVGMGHDMFSLCKNTTEMLAEYYRNRGLKAFSGKGYKFSHRTFIATQLKNILHVSQNKYSDLIKSRNELTNSLKELTPESNEYQTIKNKIAEIDKEIRTIDEDYVQRLNRIKTQISSEQYSLDDIRGVDPEFAAAYEEFLARDNTGHKYGKQALLRNDYWNEVLVGNPEIEAIYTKNLKSLPEEYLQLAQEKGIKIILLK